METKRQPQWSWHSDELIAADGTKIIYKTDNGACGDPECCGDYAEYMVVTEQALIAAAPDMLAALKWDAEQLYAILSSDLGGDIPSRIIAAQEHIKAIRAAVSKAEGRS